MSTAMAPTAEASPTETPVSPSTPTPVPTATPAPVIFYQNNFNEPSIGWMFLRGGDLELGFVGGEYRILVKEPGRNWLVQAGPPLSDFDVRIKVRYEGAALEKSYGLIFRYEVGDNLGDNLYVFEINPVTGQYLLRKQERDKSTTIIDWTASPHIIIGTTANVLRVIARGSRFELYANDQLLDTAVDQTFTVGRIGLFASNGKDPNGAEIFFDDLIVREFAPPPVLKLTPISPPTLTGSPPPTPPPTTIPALVSFSETCSAVVPPSASIQECSVEAVGPGRFTASIRTGRDEGFGWRVQVNAARRLPKEVVCNRTQGVGDGNVICEVPEGVRTVVEIGGQLKSKVGGGKPTEITIKVDFLQYASPTEPKPLAHSAVCSADKPLRTNQRCSVQAIGPGRFTASIRTGRDVGFRWRVQVNDVRRLPKEVVCNRTQGVGDGDVTCEVPEGTRTEVEISGTLLSNYGSGNSPEIAIKADFLQYAAPTEPKRLAHSAVCSAVVLPATHQRCSVQAIGPGTFTASIRTGREVPYSWRVQVNDVKRLPKEVVCNRTEGVGDGTVTCVVPEGVRTEVEISGQLSADKGKPTEITIKVDFSQ